MRAKGYIRSIRLAHRKFGLALFNCALTFARGRWNAASNTMIFDYDDSAHTMHGNDPLSWDAAVRACVRLVDSFDPNSYRHYLAAE